MTTDSYQIGCCDVQDVPYTSGIGQSFTTTQFTDFEYTTHIRVDILMSRTQDFDGDLEVQLWCDLETDQEVSLCDPVIIDNEDIPIGITPNTYVSVELKVCPWQVVGKKLYVTFSPKSATGGSFSVISTTPYSDRYHYGSKWMIENGEWKEQYYQDICMKIYAKSDCRELSWCEYKYIDALRCSRAMVKINLPGVCTIGGKIVDYKIGKSLNEPYEWIPFTMTIEEVNTKNMSC